MDQIVQQAMGKWPNVPHCDGWLRLDARGYWRMRDEQAQGLNTSGDKIAHPALLAFINRNYGCDAQGQYYFQNGPQRVYVDLALTPYIAHTDHTDPQSAFVLHTGEPLGPISAAWLLEEGQLLLQAGDSVAAVDDRDGAAITGLLRSGGKPAGDEAILDWLDGNDTALLHLHTPQGDVPLQRLKTAQLPEKFGFIVQPRAT